MSLSRGGEIKEKMKKKRFRGRVLSMECGSVKKLTDAEQSVHISPERWNNFGVADFVRI